MKTLVRCDQCPPPHHLCKPQKNNKAMLSSLPGTHSQLQKDLIALDHLGFKSYYSLVDKDATKVFKFSSIDTYNELRVTSHGNDCSIYCPQ